MARQVHTQTQPSSSMALATLDRVNFHYVKCPHSESNPNEIIHFDEFLDKPSPTEPSSPMYTVVSMGDTPEGRRLTGSSKMALLRCTMEDKIAEMKADADASGAYIKAKTEGVGANNVPGQFEEFEKIEGGVLSI